QLIGAGLASWLFGWLFAPQKP
ncbi:MAG: hypothetical protein Dbin4_02458, partial [Alphaproteobacteria bacterium]|nr:hypothetical protein [Alphaproteobacteria bacterium]